MKKIFYLVLNFVFLFSYAQKIKNTKMINDQPIYTLKISVANPYETYINDMPVEKDYGKGSANSELPINDFILKSGIQNIKVILMPEQGKLTVDKLGIDYVDVKIYKYPHGLSNMSSDERILIKEFNLKECKESSIIRKESEFITKVPYEVKGWEKSISLLAENQENLKGEVLAKYEELKTMLNNGDLATFLNSNKIRDEEVSISFYDNQETEEEDKSFMSNRVSKSRGKMEKIENYTMRFYGNGKTVSLEGTNGKSILKGDDGKKIYYYMILLHRPKAGAPLEIIR